MNKSNNTRSQIQLNESNVSKANFNQSNIKNQSQIDDDNGDGLNKSSQLNNKS